MSNTLLQARNLHKAYIMGREPLHVLRGASITVSRGEFVAITGSSGSGKSTLLHLLGALDVPDRGSVQFQGQDLFASSKQSRRRYRNEEVGFVFQFYHLLPECNILENVMLPRMVAHSFWKWLSVRREVRREAEALIDRLGLSQRIKHRPNQLSGGERQRVAIARALINHPAVLLADEPTGNLDAVIGRDILSLLIDLNRDGQTIIMVTHNAEIASMADRNLHLHQGVLTDASESGSPSMTVESVTKEVST